MNNFMPELVGARTDTGPVRSANEDAYWVSHAGAPTELGALYIVADGVGGQESGDVAANKATEVISETFYQYRRDGTEIAAALERAIRTANQIIFEEAQTRGGVKMGCTVVAAVIHEGYLYVSHVGDARAYFLMGQQLKRLTRDDTWVQEQVEARVLTPEQAANHELRNVVTQVLGNKEEIEVHVARPLELFSEDILLLCSDGLYDPLNFQQINLLLQGKSAQSAAEDLVQASISAHTHDNVTAVVVNAGQIPGKVRAGAAPARTGRPTIPTWVFATLTVTVLLFLAIFVFFVLPNTNFAGGGEPTEEPAIALPTRIVPIETDAPALQAVPTEVETDVIDPTMTTAPTATLEPVASSTPSATDTPPPPIEARACILFEPFVWQDEQIQSDSCNQFTDTTITNGQEVILLESNPVTVNGPDNACEANRFLKIQSVADPSLAGWVLASNVQPLSPGESCLP